MALSGAERAGIVCLTSDFILMSYSMKGSMQIRVYFSSTQSLEEDKDLSSVPSRLAPEYGCGQQNLDTRRRT